MSECIYNLLPVPPTKAVKEKMYKSRYRNQVVAENISYKAPSKTMGPPSTHKLEDSEKFLKSKEAHNVRKPPKIHKTGDNKCTLSARRPPIPLHKCEKSSELTEKHFIKDNKVEVISSIPRSHPPVQVDKCTGDKFPLARAGLTKDLILSDKFGNVPNYLLERKKELERSERLMELYEKEVRRRNELYQVPDKEKEVIVEQLKSRWANLHHQYLLLSVVIDTIPKKQRKERLENEMKQLEKDIQTLDAHKYLYVL